MLKLLHSTPSRQTERPSSRDDDLAPLVQSVIGGESGTARTLLIALGPHLLRVVRRVLGKTHPDIEDVAQEAAFGILEALPRYRGECSVVHFACRVAVLTAMNARRKHDAAKRTILKPSEGNVEELATAQPSPYADLTSRTTADAVRTLLAELPEMQAETLALHCVLGFTVAEIASSGRISTETVRSRLKQARRALRARMSTDPILREIVEQVP